MAQVSAVQWYNIPTSALAAHDARVEMKPMVAVKTSTRTRIAPPKIAALMSEPRLIFNVPSLLNDSMVVVDDYEPKCGAKLLSVPTPRLCRHSPYCPPSELTPNPHTIDGPLAPV